jgi:hypothetical protein
MQGLVQVKAEIPRDLKRRAFAVLAWREERFNHWLCGQLERWLKEMEESQKEDGDQLVGLSATEGKNL